MLFKHKQTTNSGKTIRLKRKTLGPATLFARGPVAPTWLQLPSFLRLTVQTRQTALWPDNSHNSLYNFFCLESVAYGNQFRSRLCRGSKVRLREGVRSHQFPSDVFPIPTPKAFPL